MGQGALLDYHVLLNAAGHQGGGADLVDASRDAFGLVKHARRGVVDDEGALGRAGYAELALDLADDLLEIERPEAVAHGQALSEGFRHPELQAAAQLGRADDEYGGERLAIHPVAEEQAQLSEHGLGEEMGFVRRLVTLVARGLALRKLAVERDARSKL